ncbi:MAG: hypothetical protein AVDCRST_MAG56-834 [uncultured Cytophagales bacterium]|uniref:Type VI secretion system contractile sheath protein TssC n=1 Tax=uncultured Cytophagales bacterium TaxID=158755 RepID=A0A6J4HM83_9SPHI|nr:MAG: hypothetical protein AVDCRST_MAG56-834 [uncultured Cytophagales bacterium]
MEKQPQIARRKETRKQKVQQLRTGYSALFKNIDDNLEYFAPEADEDTLNMFLEESAFRDKRRELRSLVSDLIELVGSSTDPGQVQARADEKMQRIAALRRKNLAAIVEKARPLEKSYRELDLFYKNAGPNTLKNVTLLNVDRQMVKDSDDESVTNKVRDILADPHLRIDQDQVYSLLAIPDFLGEKLIQTYAGIADDNKVLFLTDYRDLPSVAAVEQYRKSEEGKRIGGPQKYWSHAVVFGNWIRMREKYPELAEKEGVFGSVAMAIAGKLYATKISQPAAGVQFGEVKSSSGIRFRPNQLEVGQLSKLGINPMADFYQQDSPWEATSLFDGANLELKHYAVVRTIDWIDKSLKHFLGKYTFELLDREKANVVHKRLVKFLDDLAENKIIEKGQLTHFARNRDQPDRFDINFKITPLWATRTFVYKIGVSKNETPQSEITE